jgi:hypothetical protein
VRSTPADDGVLLQLDGASETTVVRRDIQSATETEILRTALVENEIRISPDGRFAAFLQIESGVYRALVALPVGGGAPKELYRMGSQWGISWQWQGLPDGRGVIAGPAKSDSSPAELWMIPLEGQSRRLNIDTRNWEEGGHFRVSPDSRHALRPLKLTASEKRSLVVFLHTLSGTVSGR